MEKTEKSRDEWEIGHGIGIFIFKKRVAPLNDWPKEPLRQNMKMKMAITFTEI